MSVMSAVTTRLSASTARRSCAAPGPAPAGGAALTLADLPRGAASVVVGVASDDVAAAQRLVDLGFVPGTPVAMVRRAPLRDPVVYRVAGYEIALRRAQASCIHVAPLS